MGQPSNYRLLLVTLLLQLGLLVVSQEELEYSNPVSNQGYIVYLFDRLSEPMFLPKGFNNDILFEMPLEYWPERYQEMESYFGELYSDLNATRITVPRAATLPDLSLPMKLGRRDHFSLFIPLHRRMAQKLLEVLLGAKSYEDFLSKAVYCRSRINPFLYVYALSVSILHRADTRGVKLPSYPSLFPEKYFAGEVFSQLREEASLVQPAKRVPVEIPQDFTATDADPEHRLAYWREDIGINLHHWHWHLIYPFSGPVNIVKKDRRGELFFYLHMQLNARYNFERFSNHLSRVKKLHNLREPIKEGYFPKLDSLISSRVWPARQYNTRLQDVNREDQQIKFDIVDLERWIDRLFSAIHMGYVETTKGKIIPLTEERGIDILGDLIESSILSINRNLYGDLHNLGHVALAYSHDPDNRYLEPIGVMGDTTTAMRDPIFYRWHEFVNSIAFEHKATLPPYTPNQLGFEGIHITDAQVLVKGGHINEFTTFWQKSDLDLSRGLDFAPGGPLFVRVTHLQHMPFTYRIQVMNDGKTRMGTVRIFMAPKYDERGIRFRFEEQRLLFIELDKFQTRLRSGRNIIERRSSESSVSVPYEQTFSEMNADQPSVSQFTFCGCGWPQHMLIPKGLPEGLLADLFIMISNYIDDRVEQRPTTNACQDGHSYCGIRGQLYPDRRPMGFPFDRIPPNNGMKLEDFLLSNMHAVNVSIHFTGKKVVSRRK
ncbi:phenoloxidase 2 [Anabrus simplex]|uniref:phenoloxidase 2 n=1 Tax=Anabrus simplex TaxID=316456 RepID=UPI0035A2F0C4